MRILKESLERNSSIAIHYTIIQQIQEEHTLYSIIFPYATLGDLSRFLYGGCAFIGKNWEQVEDMKGKFPDVEKNSPELKGVLLDQCSQLAGALEYLHNGFKTKPSSSAPRSITVHCAHMDLKPANILIFKSSGMPVGHWKLCDFGISVLGAKPTEQGLPTVTSGDLELIAMGQTIHTISKQRPSTYQPPEVAYPNQYEPPQVLGGRSVDIWSYGAIFAEVLAFALGGQEEVRYLAEYRTKRQPEPHLSNSRVDVPQTLVGAGYFYSHRTETRPNSPSPQAGTSAGRPSTICELRQEVSSWLNTIYDHAASSALGQPCLACWAECVRTILQIDPNKRPDARRLQDMIENFKDGCSKSKNQHTTLQNPPNRKLNDSRGFQPVSTPSEHEMTAGLGNSSSETPSSNLISSGNTTIENPDSSIQKAEISVSSQFKTIQPKVSISSSAEEVIDHDTCENRLVYLTRKDIQVFDLTIYSGSEGSLRTQSSKKIALPTRLKSHGWKGIRLTTPYVAVWGFCNSANKSDVSTGFRFCSRSF